MFLYSSTLEYGYSIIFIDAYLGEIEFDGFNT